LSADVERRESDKHLACCSRPYRRGRLFVLAVVFRVEEVAVHEAG